MKTLLSPAIGLMLIGLAIALAWDRAAAQSALDAEVIKAGLHTTTVEEGGFVDRVVTLVRQRRLPPGLVEKTYQWARNKPEHKFQYFRQAMIVQAKRLGVKLQ